MYRRRFLQVSAPTFVAIGSGCLSRQKQKPSLSIVFISVKNLSSADLEFDIAVVTENETVFESNRLISGGDAIEIKRPVDDPGDYSLRLSAQGRTVTQEISLFAKGDDECVSLTGELDQSGRLLIEGNGYNRCQP